jgi:precorrin-2 C(20)-methyltransferase
MAKLYAIGVGSENSELMTLKATRVLQDVDVIACPEKQCDKGMAFHIAEQVAATLAKKDTMMMHFPMIKGRDAMIKTHDQVTERILTMLRRNKTVALLALGDEGFYSTVSQVLEEVQETGFRTEIVCGIPSHMSTVAV